MTFDVRSNIISILRKNPMSSANVYIELKKDPNFTRSYRTTQNDVQGLVRDGEIIPHSLGRETVYRVNEKQNLNPQESFFIHFWNELFEISRDLFSQQQRGIGGNIPVNPTTIFVRLRTLVFMLPNAVKEPLKKDFDSITDNIEEYGSIRKGGIDYHKDLILVSDLVGKVSDVVHDWEKKNSEKDSAKDR